MNNKRFFLSEVDGHLYRDGNMSSPFRKRMMYWTDKIKSVADLKAVIRVSDRAFGDTSLVLLMDDDGVLCDACARSEFSQIAGAVAGKDNNGWRAVGACMDNELEACICDNCAKVIVEDLEEDMETADELDEIDPTRGPDFNNELN